MRWAVLLATLGCAAPSEKLDVWVSPERLTHDVPGAQAGDPVAVLAGWEAWRAHGEWEPAGGWLHLSFDVPPGRYRYALQVGAQVVADPLVAASVFVPDPLKRTDDPYSTEVSEVQVPAPVRQIAASPKDGLIYQIIIDRFAAPAAPATPGDRAGGTLDGVRAAVEAGYFDKLGVTTLWLSPLYQNPDGHHVGRDGHLYEAYHGYWPAQPRTVEPKLGGEAALEALMASAHARGLRVIADAVPNHVHQTHPYFAAHARSPSMSDPALQSWFNDGPTACVCGDASCDWGSHIETCWFGPELPDLNWRNPEVAAAGADDLVWWLGRFGLDGLRIDAVPMMPRAATRDIARAVRQNAAGALIIGEDYTGPGDEGREEIRAYLDQKLDGLDSAFDFPLMWAARRAIAQSDPSFGFDALEGEVDAGTQAWAGSGAVIAHMLDNHDTTRFASEAAGDAGGDPWTQAPPQSNDPNVYAKQLMGLAFILTLPGIPVIYYGDEIALAGAGDPDSRRVMPKALSPLQQDLLAKVQRLGRARACVQGERKLLFADADHEVVQRGSALITLARDGKPMAPPSGYRAVIDGLLWLPDDDACWERLQ